MIIQFKHFHDSLNIVVILTPGREIFFNIYGMKLNEEHFSFGTVIIHF